MSTEITIYPLRATKKELCDLLKSMNFKKCKHLWDWPKNAVNFFGFVSEDYKSFDGVEATVYRASQKEKEIYNGVEWAVHTRVRASGSEFDQRLQNEVIKEIRKKFGGNFYNDWLGKNRYRIVEGDKRKPVGRGVAIVFEYVVEQFGKLAFIIPDELKITGKSKIEKFFSQIDPYKILYNALVPFVVAGFEYFFKEIFIILFKYSKVSKKKLEKKTGNVPFSDILKISKKEMSIPELIAKEYSFQNITEINNAYKNWLDIDVLRAVNYSKNIGKKRKSINDRITDLIMGRHKIIHNFFCDYNLNKKRFLQLLNFILKIFNSFLDFLEKEKKIFVRDNYLKIYRKYSFNKKSYL